MLETAGDFARGRRVRNVNRRLPRCRSRQTAKVSYQSGSPPATFAVTTNSYLRFSGAMVESRHFIGGEYVVSKSGKTMDLYSPATEALVAQVPLAEAAEVDAAVASCQVAFQAWRRTSGAVRSAALNKLAALLRENVATLAKLEAQSMGVPSSVYPLFLGATAAALEHFAALALLNQGVSSLNSPGHVNFTMKQPFGVVGAILPWNVPLTMFAFKVGPAVAAGNAVVVKTSEKAPLTSAFAAKLAIEAGFPVGLINVIHGDGSTGALLCSHPQVRKISFTGSAATGRKVAAACANSNLKNVTLELGGKSPAIVFEDADLENAAQALAFSMFRNSGQICAAQTRLYVQQTVKEKFIALYQKKWTDMVKHGDPLDAATTQGPMADKIQYDAVSKMIAIGKTEGTLAFGGGRVGSKGYFIEPTLFTDLAKDATLNKQEIFGPVAVLNTFETEEEALQLANDTEYGLSSSVFTSNVSRAMRVAEALEAGNVNVNTLNTTAFDMPFGGNKQSGIGRELGRDALEAYVEVKSVFFKLV